MSCRVVVFDVMGTLVYDPFYREVPAFFGMSLAELIAAKHPTAWVEFERGERDAEGYWSHMFHDGRPVDRAGLERVFRNHYRWLDGMRDLVERLRARGVALHACSNYTPWYAWIEEELNLSRYVPWTYVSCEVGWRKPAREAYEETARRAGVEKRAPAES